MISTDEDPGLRIECFAITRLRGVTTKIKMHSFTMQTFKELMLNVVQHKSTQKKTLRLDTSYRIAKVETCSLRPCEKNDCNGKRALDSKDNIMI